jgi:hypothetical protein
LQAFNLSEDDPPDASKRRELGKFSNLAGGGHHAEIYIQALEVATTAAGFFDLWFAIFFPKA